MTQLTMSLSWNKNSRPRRKKPRPMQRTRRPAELELPRKAVRERVRLGHQLRIWQLQSLSPWIGLAHNA